MSIGLNKDLVGPPGPGFPGAPAWLSAPSPDVGDQKTIVVPTCDDEPTPEPPTECDPNDWGSLDEPVDCPQCGSFGCWFDMVGGHHCKKCDPPSTSRRLRWLREKQLAQQPERQWRTKRSEPPTGPHCPRCWSESFTDTAIHDGRSKRRECAECRRFVGFPVWHGVTRSNPPVPRLTQGETSGARCA